MKRITALLGVVCIGVFVHAAIAQDAKPGSPVPPEGRRVGTPPVTIKTPGPLDRLQTSTRHHEWAEIESAGGRKVKTWVVYPEVDHPATVVVLIHENRGLTDWVRALADQVAEAGFVAVAPDLLSGTGPDGGGTAEYGSEDKAIQAVYGLKPEQVMADLDAVFKHASEIGAGNKVVAVAGFCWGGGKTFEYATHNPKVAAACVFYGSAPKDESSYKKIKAPVYGFYGGDDFRITGEVPKVEKLMKSLDKKFEPVIYKDAKHAFMRQGELATEAGDPNRKARDEAFARLKKLLSQLKPSAVKGGDGGASTNAPRDPVAKGTATVVGTVVADGKPLPKARVSLVFERPAVIGQAPELVSGPTTQTDAEGQFKFENVKPEGHVGAIADCEGYTSHGTRSIKLSPGAEVKMSEIQLKSRGAFVAGIVVDPDGKPVAGADISAWERDGYAGISYGPDGPPPPTDAKGRFRIEGLPKVPLKLMAQIRPREQRKDLSIHFPAWRNAEPGQTDVRIVLDPKLQRPLP